uniref:Uracil-DNA glycosylase n=1 Tax=Oreochromis niloticus TaxID=8128 RepID=A0A669AUW2_ORENI
MIGQKTINSFFSPVSKKRSSTELIESEEDANEPKKQKGCGVETEQSSPRPAPLSPEQLDKIARNKKAALERLASAQTPPGFGESWRKALSAEFGKPYFKQLTSFVCEERKRHTVYPPAEHVFTWTQMCDIRDVKVVILGQDPYHGPNQAHGLCFSVKRPVPPPPSLENMFKELSSDIKGFQHPGHGDLTGWAQQGVLLLNAVLTVRAHQANSHKDRGWEAFTDAVVQWLSKNLEGLVFMLWGSYAQKKGAAIDRVSCFNPGSFSLSFIMCFHTKFSLCVFIETSPRLAGCSSVSPVCSSGVFWVQTLLKGQRAATKIWKVSH